MRRTQRDLDPEVPVEALALKLRALWEQQGRPNVRGMATPACRSYTVLYEAMRGRRRPTWETITGFVAALRLDRTQEAAAHDELRAAWETAGGTSQQAPPPSDRPLAARGHWRVPRVRRGWAWAAAGAVVVPLLVTWHPWSSSASTSGAVPVAGGHFESVELHPGERALMLADLEAPAAGPSECAPRTVAAHHFPANADARGFVQLSEPGSTARTGVHVTMEWGPHKVDDTVTVTPGDPTTLRHGTLLTFDALPVAPGREDPNLKIELSDPACVTFGMAAANVVAAPDLDIQTDHTGTGWR